MLRVRRIGGYDYLTGPVRDLATIREARLNPQIEIVITPVSGDNHAAENLDKVANEATALTMIR